jgi:hypothetical protein
MHGLSRASWLVRTIGCRPSTLAPRRTACRRRSVQGRLGGVAGRPPVRPCPAHQGECHSPVGADDKRLKEDGIAAELELCRGELACLQDDHDQSGKELWRRALGGQAGGQQSSCGAQGLPGGGGQPAKFA